jgi:hypothetical protein
MGGRQKTTLFMGYGGATERVKRPEKSEEKKSKKKSRKK